MSGIKGNGPDACNIQPAETHENTSPAILTEADAERKRFDTMAARAAIMGHTLAKLGSGYLLSKWGHVRHFVDLDTAEAMLRRIEGGKS
jgi:hypothetical protein